MSAACVTMLKLDPTLVLRKKAKIILQTLLPSLMGHGMSMFQGKSAALLDYYFPIIEEHNVNHEENKSDSERNSEGNPEDFRKN